MRVPWYQSGLKNPQRRPKRKLWYAARILMAAPTDKRFFSKRSQQKLTVNQIRHDSSIKSAAFISKKKAPAEAGA